MVTMLSPGVTVVEKDFTTIVPTVASGIGGMVGRFSKGPVEVPVLVSSEAELVKYFGTPTDTNANEWFTVAEFLKYTNKCWVVRSKNAGVLNATSTGTGVSIVNIDDYEAIQSGTRDTAGTFISKQTGTTANDIGVMVIDASTWDEFLTWNTTNLSKLPGKKSLASYFSGAPNSSPFMEKRALDNTPKNDEVHVLIIDITGKKSKGVRYTILEKFEGLSKASDATDYKGNSIYYVNVLNTKSDHVWWSKHPTATNGANDIEFGAESYLAAEVGKAFASISVVSSPFFSYNILKGGVIGTPSTVSEIKDAYDKLANKDVYDVNLIMAGAFSVGAAGEIEKYVLENVAHERKDCVAFISPHTTGAPIRDGATANTLVYDFKVAVGVADDVASYGFMDTGMKYIHDDYNKKYRWVPLNGDIAGLAARVDTTNDAWWSFGGPNRGGIKNVLKLAYNPNQAHRDYLYPKGINPVNIDPTSGPILYGDRTMTSKPSAFDRINVRRLFIVLEKSISIAAKWSLFEFNDSFTRSQFKNMVEPYLRMVQGRRGITDFRVICDTSNNTGEIIDRNEFIADIYIKPARSINFITLNFVATKTGVEFSQVIGG